MKPDLELAARKVNTREARNIEVFSLEAIRRHFIDSEKIIIRQIQVADNLINEGKADEAKDILRSQIVFIEAAFDFYLHELLKLGIQNIFHKEWKPVTEKYKNLQLDMKTLEEALQDNVSDEWLKKWITDKYAGVSLMSYERFDEVCKLLGLDIQEIADEAFYERASREKTKDKLKAKINRLFIRRNQIAHQSDRKRENAEREEISRGYVIEALNDMRKIIESINSSAEKKNDKQ